MDIKQALNTIKDEYIDNAVGTFDSFNTYHEGYAVLKEELDELWDEIKGKQRKRVLIEEASQVGAMALRFLIDLCEDVEITDTIYRDPDPLK